MELRFRVEGVHNLSEGGLTHIIENMWVGLASIQVGANLGGLASIQVGSLPLWTIYSIADYLFMMSCTIYHFSPFWTFMIWTFKMLCTYSCRFRVQVFCHSFPPGPPSPHDHRDPQRDPHDHRDPQRDPRAPGTT